MTDKNIFDGKDKEPIVPNPAKQEEPNPLLTKLQEIKNEDGSTKYGSLEIAMDALKTSQEYIPTLKTQLEAKEAELVELKKSQEANESVETIVERLLQSQNKQQEPTHQQAPAGLNEENVATIVRKEQDRIQVEAIHAANEAKVTEALTRQFGENTKEEVAKKATELGITPERLGALALESPDMVLKLFNNEIKTSTPIISDVNTSNFLKSPDKELESPSKSLLSGASSKDQLAYMKEIKEAVYKKHGVTA